MRKILNNFFAKYFKKNEKRTLVIDLTNSNYSDADFKYLSELKNEFNIILKPVSDFPFPDCSIIEELIKNNIVLGVCIEDSRGGLPAEFLDYKANKHV